MSAGTPERFDHPVAVVEADIDANGHANNVVYLRWIQEAAVAHWSALAPGELAASASWAVVRHEIDYKRPALVDDALVVRTWVGATSAATSERLSEVIRPADGQVLARGRTVWCLFDRATGRPGRITPAIKAILGGGPGA